MIDEDLPNLWTPALLGVIFSAALFAGAFSFYAVLPSESNESLVIPPSNVWEENGSRIEIQYAIVDWDYGTTPYWDTQVIFLLDHLQVRWVVYDFEAYISGVLPFPFRHNLLPTPPEWDKVLPNDTWEVILGDPEQLVSYSAGSSGHGDVFRIHPETDTIGTLYVSFILPDDRLIELSLPFTNGTYPVARWIPNPPS
jgi:hypothetical protein